MNRPDPHLRPSKPVQDLLPPAVARRIPRLGASGETPLLEVAAQAKIVDHASHWRWYVIEWDGENTCYGLILTSGFAVVGQFTLTELEALQGPEPSLRCDPEFQPCKVSDLMRSEPAIAQLVAGSGLDLVELD